MNPREEELLQAAQAVLKSVAIPAQPRIVMELMKLSNQPGVDVHQIAKKVEKDPALAAKVLKVANSPLFGLKRSLDSIGQALHLMGFQLFQRAILASSLRDVLQGDRSATSEVFWIHSELTARCCEVVAKRLRPELAQQAYLVGLFHDCAISILGRKFPDYQDLVHKALSYRQEAVEEEERRYSTNHCVMGYLFTRSWYLPETVRLAILRHHDGEPEYSDDIDARALAAILRVSEYIVQDYDASGNMKTVEVSEWLEASSGFLDILGLYSQDMVDIEEQFLDAVR